MGAQRGDILDTISGPFIHSGHPGMYQVTRHADALRNYTELPDAERFPPNWSFDPGAFDSGMDYSVREATPEDLRRLTDWYERVLGEGPKHARFLAEHRPDLLKAYRNRYEHAIRESLPAQMLPFLMLHYNAVRGFKDGIRENALLAKALGLTRPQVLNAICLAELHGGAEVFDVVAEAAGDVYPNVADGLASFADLRELLSAADVVAGNCEGAYSDRPSPAPSHKHMMVSPTERGSMLGAAGFDVLSLANNHMIDGGYAGLEDTRELLASQGIATMGAGENLAAAL